MTEEIVIERTATEVWVGPDYLYKMHGENHGEFFITYFERRGSENPIDLVRSLKCLNAIMESNRPAQCALYRTIFSLMGTQYDGLQKELDRKFEGGDLTYIEQLVPFLKEQMSGLGLHLFIPKLSDSGYSKLMRCKGVTLDTWIDEVRKEVEENPIFNFSMVRATGHYPFTFDLK